MGEVCICVIACEFFNEATLWRCFLAISGHLDPCWAGLHMLLDQAVGRRATNEKKIKNASFSWVPGPWFLVLKPSFFPLHTSLLSRLVTLLSKTSTPDSSSSSPVGCLLSYFLPQTHLFSEIRHWIIIIEWPIQGQRLYQCSWYTNRGISLYFWPGFPDLEKLKARLLRPTSYV